MTHKIGQDLRLVELRHGAGGRATHQLIETIFKKHLGNPILDKGDDGARLGGDLNPEPGASWVVTTDAFVVSPLFFPGGCIGDLAINGTVNDLAMMGANPSVLTAAFILEEGFALEKLERIVIAMADAARVAQVTVVAGDTKVVERGKGDGLFIMTSGLGSVSPGIRPCGRGAIPGDQIIVSGTLGDHALALLKARDPLTYNAHFISDTAPLNGMVNRLRKVAPGALHVLRDPTRGGLGNTLNEIAHQSGVGMELTESLIPVRAEVQAATELLGLDPLYLANEGKLVLITSPSEAQACLRALHEDPLGREARIIGEVVATQEAYVALRTPLGGRRLVDWLSADPLPRIC